MIPEDKLSSYLKILARQMAMESHWTNGILWFTLSFRVIMLGCAPMLFHTGHWIWGLIFVWSGLTGNVTFNGERV